MLVQFIVKNYLSFRDENVFNFLASSDNKSHSNHIIKSKTHYEKRLLRVGALYGANASGKSNLIKAISFMRDLILKGTTKDDIIDIDPFRLDKSYQKRPSKFEIIFIINNVIYHYGFKADKYKIHEEWLLANERGKTVTYFQRFTNKQNENEYKFGLSLYKKSKSQKQFLDFVMKGTRPNQLFLSEASERNVKEVDPIIEWLRNSLIIIKPNAHYYPLESRTKSGGNFSELLCQILRMADTDIKNVTYEEKPINLIERFPDLPEKARQNIKNVLKKKGMIRISDGVSYQVLTGTKDDRVIELILKLQHQDSDGDFIDFDFKEESDGTQRLIHLAPLLVDLLIHKSSKTYLIDELDRRFHPLLSKAFLKTFLNNVSNKNTSQILFTTHEINLLNLDLLRRDEIWLIKKDKYGGSQLSSLNEYKIRKDLNIQKGYLNGRFGAIPFISDVELVGWK